MAGKVSVATNPSSTNLLCRNSIPTSWNENGYPLLIMGENARRIEKDSLKNGAILDVHAARILTEKGIDANRSYIDFVREMICRVTENVDEQSADSMIEAMLKLSEYLEDGAKN
jgi:hypothetical protein